MIVVTAAIWCENGRVLIARRKPGRRHAGRWEFPGGKLRPGETPEEGLARELREELGIEARVGDFFGESLDAGHTPPIRLLAYRIQEAAGTPRCLDHAELRWVPIPELAREDLCPADRELAARLRRES
ncbi:MAG: (deoxy)nucleoside triphosphate pyrophosphohydrolase [Desulfobacterales bacterium]